LKVEEIRELIKKGETEKVEFKKVFDKEVIETSVAFANKEGGIILVGIDDEGIIKGVSTSKETLKNWLNNISQATEPVIIPEIESHDINRKNVVVITIKDSPIKPISYKGICYLRIKNSNRKLTPKDVAELHLQTIGSTWDGYPAIDAKLEDIDLKKVDEYIKLTNEAGRRKIREKPLEVLKKLELVKDNKPTWASILLFGKEKFVSKRRVHCGKFKLSKREILDDRMVECDLIHQVEEVMDFIKKHKKLVLSDKEEFKAFVEYLTCIIAKLKK